MPTDEATPNQSSPQSSQPTSDTGNAGPGAGDGSAGPQTGPDSVPAIKPIALVPHRRGLFEIPKISRQRGR